MPRPLSWLPRLPEIRRAVSGSVRSHYDRRDLETIFELQPRAAQKLLELLSTVTIGTSRLVEQGELAKFLDGVHKADDVPDFLEHVRSKRARPSQKKIRSLVRRDIEPATIASLPQGMTLAPGRLEISFQTVEQLAEAMYALARILEAEGDEFAQLFEIETSTLRPPADEGI